MKSFLSIVVALLAFGTVGISFGSVAQTKEKWVDSIYRQMSLEERIGQMFMVAAYSGGKNKNQAEIEKLLENNQIGGLIFMQGTPEAQASLTNLYQEKASVPLLIGMDAEWGLGMRLTGVTDYPKQMMLGATRDTALMYQIAAAIAAQCKRMGVHINFAPDVDINNNPANPVINFRSFGEDKQWVSRMGIAYMRGLQDNGIIACAKHFPGHGDVAVDSHKDLPVIRKSKAALQALELAPFRALIHAGVGSIMIAHLSVPALEPARNLPTTLSKKVVTGLLKQEMGYDGLVITDALNMRGVTKYFPDGETDLRAFLAGNDILLFSQNVPLAIQKIKNAIETGKASTEELAYHVKKILAAKYDAGLANLHPVKVENATRDLNLLTPGFKEKTARAAITLLRDQRALLQKLRSPDTRVTYVNVNGNSPTYLQNELKKAFPGLRTITSPEKIAAEDFQKRCASADVVVVGIHDLSRYPGSGGDYGLSAAQTAFVQRIAPQDKVLFVVFGNAYFVKFLCRAQGVIVTYEDDDFTENAVHQLLIGKIAAPGTLPVSACK